MTMSIIFRSEYHEFGTTDLRKDPHYLTVWVVCNTIGMGESVSVLRRHLFSATGNFNPFRLFGLVNPWRTCLSLTDTERKTNFSVQVICLFCSLISLRFKAMLVAITSRPHELLVYFNRLISHNFQMCPNPPIKGIAQTLSGFLTITLPHDKCQEICFVHSCHYHHGRPRTPKFVGITIECT